MNKIAYLLSLFALLYGLNLPAAEAPEEITVPQGPHGGRLLQDGGFAVELAIFEEGVAPEYHAWAYQDEKELPLSDWQLAVTLERLGGKREDFAFLPASGYLLGQSEVKEPHSFDVTVTARHGGTAHTWRYPSYEGRAQLAPGMAETLGVGTQRAGAGTLHQSILLYGKIVPDPQGVSHVTARYPGMIRRINADLGARVKAGDVLAVIEANSSLQSYSLTAPINGLVVQRHANPGEIAGDQPLITLADYSHVWVDLDVFPGDAGKVRPGQHVAITMSDLTAESDILYLNPGEGASPNVVARVPLANPEGRWTPGLLVEGSVAVADVSVALMVDNRALQTFRDWQVVFLKVGDNYEVRPLTLGRGDGHFTEVLAGLDAGDEYVVVNSYLLKADVEKAGAVHDH
jgi:cobalt-zinc-cadmium efflux system membrane fusion protein